LRRLSKVATGRIERTISFLFGVETADVGMDVYTPVTSDYLKGKNQFTGKIDKVTIDLKKTNAPAEAAKSETEEKEAGDALDIN
jgi:arylsulfatase